MKKKAKAKKVKKKKIAPDISAVARALAAARWAKPDADREQPKRAGLLGGRPKGTVVKGMPRCPCGANTLKRAEARGFDCCKKAGIVE